MSLFYQGSLRREKRPTIPRDTNQAQKLGKVVAKKTVSTIVNPMVALSKSAAEKTISPTPATKLSRRIVALGKADPEQQAFFWRGGYLAEELRSLRKAMLERPETPPERPEVKHPAATLAIRHDKEFAERFARALLTDLCGVDLTAESSALRYLVTEGNKQRQSGVVDPFVRFNTDIPGASLEFRSPGISAGMGDITTMPLNITARIESK